MCAVKERRAARERAQVLGRDADLAHKRAKCGIRRERDLEPTVHRPALVPVGAGPTPGSGLGLDHAHRVARARQPHGAGQPRHPGADHDDVDADVLSLVHAPMLATALDMGRAAPPRGGRKITKHTRRRSRMRATA